VSFSAFRSGWQFGMSDNSDDLVVNIIVEEEPQPSPLKKPNTIISFAQR
jgi:hypothetical protein